MKEVSRCLLAFIIISLSACSVKLSNSVSRKESVTYIGLNASSPFSLKKRQLKVTFNPDKATLYFEDRIEVESIPNYRNKENKTLILVINERTVIDTIEIQSPLSESKVIDNFSITLLRDKPDFLNTLSREFQRYNPDYLKSAKIISIPLTESILFQDRLYITIHYFLGSTYFTRSRGATNFIRLSSSQFIFPLINELPILTEVTVSVPSKFVVFVDSSPLAFMKKGRRKVYKTRVAASVKDLNIYIGKYFVKSTVSKSLKLTIYSLAEIKNPENIRAEILRIFDFVAGYTNVKRLPGELYIIVTDGNEGSNVSKFAIYVDATALEAVESKLLPTAFVRSIIVYVLQSQFFEVDNYKWLQGLALFLSDYYFAVKLKLKKFADIRYKKLVIYSIIRREMELMRYKRETIYGLREEAEVIKYEFFFIYLSSIISEDKLFSVLPQLSKQFEGKRVNFSNLISMIFEKYNVDLSNWLGFLQIEDLPVVSIESTINKKLNTLTIRILNGAYLFNLYRNYKISLFAKNSETPAIIDLQDARIEDNNLVLELKELDVGNISGIIFDSENIVFRRLPLKEWSPNLGALVLSNSPAVVFNNTTGTGWVDFLTLLDEIEKLVDVKVFYNDKININYFVVEKGPREGDRLEKTFSNCNVLYVNMSDTEVNNFFEYLRKLDISDYTGFVNEFGNKLEGCSGIVTFAIEDKFISLFINKNRLKNKELAKEIVFQSFWYSYYFTCSLEKPKIFFGDFNIQPARHILRTN